MEEQRARDAVEVPGLSKAALGTLNQVQVAIHATQERQREEAMAGAWAAGRTDPRVAAELDRFMAAAERRLGEKGMGEASRAAHYGRGMAVPGAGREHQAGLDTLGLCCKVLSDHKGWCLPIGAEAYILWSGKTLQQSHPARLHSGLGYRSPMTYEAEKVPDPNEL